jgi:signal transduction histidine kinase
MRQRLQEIGGRCEIQSQRGQGTRVTFFLPVKEAAK